MPTFMKVTDKKGALLIKGESTYKLYTNWIELESFSHQQRSNATTSSASRGDEKSGYIASGITADWNAGGMLIVFSTKGTLFEVEVHTLKEGTSTAYLVYKFDSCIAGSISPSGTNNGGMPKYAFNFGYASRSITFFGPDTP